MKTYKPVISLTKNGRGIWDLDPSKGCASGCAESKSGCYGDCYAARSAKIRGYDFSKTVLRDFTGVRHVRQIVNKINKIDMPFIRMGCSGDPSENWAHTLSIIKKIAPCNKEIVLITKHWSVLTDAQLQELETYRVCINTSVSALDTVEQLKKCLEQYERLKAVCKSFLRVVSCDFNKNNETGLALSFIQDMLFNNKNVIDTVFRPSKNNSLVINGIINVKTGRFMGNKTLMSKLNRKTFTGTCDKCSEKCGVFNDKFRSTEVPKQLELF